MKNLTLKCFTTAVLCSITTFAYGLTNYFLAGNFPDYSSTPSETEEWCVINQVTNLDIINTINLKANFGIDPNVAIAQINAGTFPYTGTDLQKFAKASTSLSALQTLKNLDPDYRSKLKTYNADLANYKSAYNQSKQYYDSSYLADKCQNLLSLLKYSERAWKDADWNKKTATETVLKAALGV